MFIPHNDEKTAGKAFVTFPPSFKGHVIRNNDKVQAYFLGGRDEAGVINAAVRKRCMKMKSAAHFMNKRRCR
jgi:hypothetical protein